MTTPTTTPASTAALIDAGLDRLERKVAELQTLVAELAAAVMPTDADGTATGR